ncbi:hypothetical protein AMJ86_05815 [bacterium SM23_57]|nr:MAG: hypothetical protein AMJ86_05815 [bacterium SM23_57]
MITYVGFDRKYPVMGYFCLKIVCIFAILLASGCAPPPKVSRPAATPEPVISERATVTVVASRENVREYPNGPIIGEVRSGEEVSIITPRGNWLHCGINDSLEGYIWAPSLGFEKLLFINVQTYFQGPKHDLMPLDSLIERLGPPSEIIQESVRYRKLVYDNTPNSNSYPFGTREFQRLELSVVQGLIAEVAVDLGKLEILQSDLLLLAGFPNERPTQSGFKGVVWDNAFPGLGRVVFDRYQGSFKSFSGVRFSKARPDRWNQVLSVKDQSCQIGKNNDVNIYVFIENADSMAYSDLSFSVTFFNEGGSQIAKSTIEPLLDVLVPNGCGEIFTELVVPQLSGRTDVNYLVKLTSAKPLFTHVSP